MGQFHRGFVCCFVFAFSFAARADVIYVDEDAIGANDGTSWQNAFVTVRDALLLSKAGDEVWVAKGRYAPSATDRGVSFELRSGVALYGGFEGTESHRDDRDWERNETSLLADIGEEGRHRDNIQRIISAVDVSDARVDGFVLNRAFNERGAPLGRGGAVYALRSAITIANCRFERNRAGGGGAMWIEDSTANVENSLIRNNRNRAVTTTGLSDVSFDRCRFANNKVKTEGGAIGSFSGGVIVVMNTVFIRNRSESRGGAAYYGIDASMFMNCAFVNNHSNEWGGGIYQFSGPVAVANCSFTGNYARFWGGGMVANDGAEIVNCAFFGNLSGRKEGEQAQLEYFDDGEIQYSLIQGWTGNLGGKGNFDADPKWVDPAGGNLRLLADSPCIDAGDDGAVTQKTDLDGNPRVLGARVDIGAYENLCADVIDLSASIVEASPDGGGGGGGGGGSGARCVGQSDGDGVCEPGEDCCVVAEVAVDPSALPAGATLRVAFAPDAGPTKVLKARVDSAGRGVAVFRGCPGGSITVCIEGCAEMPCRDVSCP